MVGLYYALGGGLGHGMRALALARELARLGDGRHVVLSNSPFAASLQAAARGANVELRTLPPATVAAEAGRWFARQCAELQPDLVVVDTFPRGLGGELADWLATWRRGLKVLVGRVLPEAYVRQFQLADLVRASFDLVVVPGEPSWPEMAGLDIVRTGPWLVRRAEELLTPTEAAVRLGCAPHERCVLVVGSGTADECREWLGWFRELAAQWPASGRPLRLALPREVDVPPDVPHPMIVRHAPLLEVLPGAAAVVGNAGYHLVHEVRWLGLRGRFLARHRLYDDQKQRLRDDERAANWDELSAQVLRDLAASAPPMPSVGPAENHGAVAAAREIARRWTTLGSPG